MDYLLNRTFVIWAYTVSHSTLILRSEMKYIDLPDYKEELGFNIDIEFSAVAYLDLPNKIPNIFLQEITVNIPERLKSYNSGYRVFEIVSEGKSYYVVAGNYLIGTNRWIGKDRVWDMALKYDVILAAS